MKKTKTEEQKIEAIKALYEVVRVNFEEVYTQMGKTLVSLAEAAKEIDLEELNSDEEA